MCDVIDLRVALSPKKLVERIHSDMIGLWIEVINSFVRKVCGDVGRIGPIEEWRGKAIVLQVCKKLRESKIVAQVPATTAPSLDAIMNRQQYPVYVARNVIDGLNNTCSMNR